MSSHFYRIAYFTPSHLRGDRVSIAAMVFGVGGKATPVLFNLICACPDSAVLLRAAQDVLMRTGSASDFGPHLELGPVRPIPVVEDPVEWVRLNVGGSQ